MLTLLTQAQFIISPDRTFSEAGAISKIDYRDRFKQYKRLIIRNADTPRMRTLVTQLERELLQVHSPDEQAAEESEIINEEDDFCTAFQNEVILSDPTPSSPVPTSPIPASPIEPAASLPNPNTPGAPLPTADIPDALPPTTRVEPPAILDNGEEPTEPIPATKKRSRKKNDDDGPTTATNNRRSTRNAGGTARKVVGGKTTKA